MKKWNFGFVMVGLAFLISILVLSCQTDETDKYSQQAVDVLIFLLLRKLIRIWKKK